ncbi:hypothetical protein ABT299_13130 [Spirillospora sp. NPDC000708]
MRTEPALKALETANRRPAPGVIHDSDQGSQYTWKKQQQNTQNPKPDVADPDQMDHFTWYETHGFTKTYPGGKKILTPAEVLGRHLPSPDADG